MHVRECRPFPLLLEIFVLITEVEFPGEYAAIPDHMQGAIRRYVMHGIKPGDFLTGIITNDLRRAVGHADGKNLPLLPLYVQWFYNEPPSGCWGSPEIMQRWMLEQQQEYHAAMGAGVDIRMA